MHPALHSVLPGMSFVRAFLRSLGYAAVLVVGAACSLPKPPSRCEAEAIGDYYRRAAGLSPVAISSPTFYNSGSAIREGMLDLVASAEEEILIDSFLINDGPMTREILDALVDKAADGVVVKVIGDASSRFVMEPEAFSYLEARGVSTAEFNPVKGWRLLAPSRLMERDHRKFWIVDGREVFLGGANLSDSSLLPPKLGGNLDLMVRFESPGAARLLARSFVETWRESEATSEIADRPGREGESEGAVKGAGDGSAYWFFNQDELGRRPSATAVMLEGLFSSARESVWLIEPYTFTNATILEAIRAMTERGVEVNLILSTQARAPRFRYASFYGIRDLLDSGARVWIFDSETSPLHYKCALIDGRIAYVGSANLNHRSLHLSRELNVVFDDPASVGEVRKVVDSVRSGSRLVGREEAGRYRALPFATWWLIMQTAG